MINMTHPSRNFFVLYTCLHGKECRALRVQLIQSFRRQNYKDYTILLFEVQEHLFRGSSSQSRHNILRLRAKAGNTKGGSITVPLTSCVACLDQPVLQIKTKIVSCHTADSKPVKQEVNGTVILPPLVFPGHGVKPVVH